MNSSTNKKNNIRKNGSGPVAASEPQSGPRSWVWILLLGFLLPPLLAFTFSSTWSTPAAEAASKPQDEAPPEAPATEVGEDAGYPRIPDSSSRSFQAPGDLLFDLNQAFKEGESSELVDLKTTSEQGRFEALQSVNAAAAAQGEESEGGLAFFLLQRQQDGTQLYDVQDSSGKSQAVVHVKLIDERWRITGLHAPGKGLPGEIDTPRDEAMAMFDSLLKKDAARPRQPAAGEASPSKSGGSPHRVD